ncbi:MAG: tRNA-specific adenosine deaminase [SAR116 cluster bacterium MED-G04]|jgi:tRNA(adenine34) deaminase|nr:MAG: tRNA-specific adenosine deaminase [SAR116 cluster bacterium MED-G04]
MNGTMFRNDAMTDALRLAAETGEAGEVPVAAIITDSAGEVIAMAGNRVERDHDPSAHAEILAIRQAAAIMGSARLNDCDLWVTLEPCAMCAAAISHARIRRLYYGADDPKSGGVAHGARVFSHATCHHKPEVYSGIGAEQSAALLKDFFARRR